MMTPTGPVVGIYEKSGARARRFIILWAIIFVIGLVCIFLWTSIPPQRPGHFDRAAEDREGALAVGALVAGLIGGIGLWNCGYLGFIRPDETLQVHNDGFILSGRNFNRPYMWDQLQDYTHAVTRRYYNGVHTGDTRRFTLRMADGAKIQVDNTFKNAKELEEVLPKVTFGPLMARVADSMKAGQNVQFGNITVTPSGLYDGKQTLAWDDVAGVNVAKGFITIWARHPEGKKPRKFSTLRFGSLPNALVFLEIVNRLSPALRQGK